MKKTRWILLALFCLISLTPSGRVRAQAPSKEDQEKAMKAWMESATPGAPHQRLAALAGNWDVVVRSWMDPSAPPTESKGTCEMSMVLGGRYLMQQVHGQMMGMPFEGLGYTGYDNVQKKYIGTWMDTMGTGMMTSTGEEDPKTGKIVYIAKVWDPTTGTEQSSREVLTKMSPDQFLFEMFMNGPDGKEVKGMEMLYTRKK